MLRTLIALTLLLAPAFRTHPNAPAARLAVIDMHLHGGHGTTAGEWNARRADLTTNDVVLATLFVHDTAADGLAKLAPYRFLVGASFPVTRAPTPLAVRASPSGTVGHNFRGFDSSTNRNACR